MFPVSFATPPIQQAGVSLAQFGIELFACLGLVQPGPVPDQQAVIHMFNWRKLTTFRSRLSVDTPRNSVASGLAPTETHCNWPRSVRQLRASDYEQSASRCERSVNNCESCRITEKSSGRHAQKMPRQSRSHSIVRKPEKKQEASYR